MTECWLKSNRRVLLLGCLPPAAMLAVSFWLWRWHWPEWSPLLLATRALGAVTGVVGIAILLRLFWEMATPRVAYSSGKLLLNLRKGPPIGVPIDIVECFFRGQGPSHVGAGVVQDAETSNIVVRLAERATEWHHADVQPSLGHWCDGYITLHGAWCQPIDRVAIEELNSRLVLVKRQIRAAANQPPEVATPGEESAQPSSGSSA